LIWYGLVNPALLCSAMVSIDLYCNIVYRTGLILAYPARSGFNISRIFTILRRQTGEDYQYYARCSNDNSFPYEDKQYHLESHKPNQGQKYRSDPSVPLNLPDAYREAFGAENRLQNFLNYGLE